MYEYVFFPFYITLNLCLTFTSGFIWYPIQTVAYYSMYKFLDYSIGDQLPPVLDKYPLLTKEYRICNGVKSGALLILSSLGVLILYNMTVDPTVNTYDMYNYLGATYAATDMAGLIYNHSCHKSTFIHHIVVQMFYFYSYSIDFDHNNGICKAITVYCIFSCFAYLVNFRLSIRNSMYPHCEKIINELSLYIYITSCVLNWIIQCYLLFGGASMHIIERLLYGGTLYLIIKDDVFLIKYLKKY